MCILFKKKSVVTVNVFIGVHFPTITDITITHSL